MERRKLIIDCDPGVDDAVALFLAFAARDALDLLGITTVGGNVAAPLTARNARLVREIAGREDVPVFAGCPRPMSRAPVEAGHFHGESGLGALTVHEPAAAAAAEHAVEFLVRTLREAPVGAITLAVTGPMTNVATALTIAPHLAGRLREIVVMGGARSEGGNITASAEYNIHADPHAAQLVFAAGCPVVALGLDLTHQVRSIPRRIDAIRAIGSPAAQAVASLLEFSSRLPAHAPREHGAPLHDPCTIAWLLQPQLFELRPCHLEVETGSPLTLGHTAVEFRARPDAPMHVRWGVGADGEGVFELLRSRLAAAAEEVAVT
jgi:purine nucleosidase